MTACYVEVVIVLPFIAQTELAPAAGGVYLVE